MKTFIARIAAALGASAFGFAAAQGPIAPHDTLIPLVDEPTAAALKADGPDAQLATELVQALNADASLKGSKMVIQPETSDTSSIIYITGVSKTEEQAKHVSEIVASHAGDAKVVNLIQPDHITMKTPEYYAQSTQ